MGKRSFIFLISLFLAVATAAAQDSAFIKGLDKSITFCAAKDGDSGKGYSFTTSGKEFKAAAMWYGNSVLVAVEDVAAGKRSVVFKDGKMTSSTGSYPKVGFSAGKESKGNDYLLSSHDFSNDGQPEFLLAVTDDKGSAIAIFIFEYDGTKWTPVGEIATAGKGLGGCRVFRQAITLKNEDTGILYTWTYHDGKFDFLASDRSTDQKQLF